tara:strand:- start:305 stop:565 length:261 start_codon:yes stop_codon:yes gene_type:complete
MPKYTDSKLDGLQELLPYPKRNGKDGYLVARGKQRIASKGGRSGRAKVVTRNPLDKFLKKAKPTTAPLTRSQILMGEIADYYKKAW